VWATGELLRNKGSARSQLQGMMLRSHSRAGRSEVISAEIQYEKPDCARRPEPEIARPDREVPAFPDFGDSVMWTPFVVTRSNINNIRGKLVTGTPSSQGAVFQRSPIFGFPSIYVYMSIYVSVRRRTTKFG